MEVSGLEPPTSAVRRQRSTGLSYTPETGASVAEGLGSPVAEDALGVALERFVQVLLYASHGKVPARLLDQAPRDVGAPPQVAGDRVRIVHRNQYCVDIFHKT